MFSGLFARILGISKETLEFVSENPQRFRIRMLIVVPIVAWGALLYQVNPLFLKWQVDSLTRDWLDLGVIKLDSVLPLFITIVVGFVLIKLLDSLLQFSKSSILFTFDRKAEEELEERFKEFAQRFDSSFLAGHNNMRLLRNLQADSRTIRQKFSNLQAILIEIPVAIIALSSILPLLHPIILSIIFVSAILSLYLQYSQSNAWRKTEFLESRYAIQSSDLLHQMYTKISVLVTNGWLDQFFGLYKRRRGKWNKVRNHQNTQDKFFDLLTSVITALTEATTTLVGGILTLTGVITIGTFTVLGLYVDRVKSLITNIGDLLRLIIELRYILTRLDYLLKITPRLTINTQQSPYQIGKIESIALDAVEYTYPKLSHDEYGFIKTIQMRFGLEKASNKRLSLASLKSFLTSTYLTSSQRRLLTEEFGDIEARLNSPETKNPKALRDFSYEFRLGNVYQLNGEAGSGKTTIVQLLKHSLEPDTGSITVKFKDKKHILIQKNLKQIPYQDWKIILGSVTNDTSFWSSFSLREVLRLGIPDALQIRSSQMIEALAIVGLKVTEADLDKIMSESIDFSDGERILIGFARLILCPKSLIIIDESIIHAKGTCQISINNMLQTLKHTSIIIIESSIVPSSIDVDFVVNL